MANVPDQGKPAVQREYSEIKQVGVLFAPHTACGTMLLLMLVCSGLASCGERDKTPSGHSDWPRTSSAAAVPLSADPSAELAEPAVLADLLSAHGLSGEALPWLRSDEPPRLRINELATPLPDLRVLEVSLIEWLEGWWSRSFYLLLERSGEGWSTADVVEWATPRDRSFAPSTRIVGGEGAGAWLVINAGGGMGTGILQRTETWFGLDRSRGRQVLRIVTDAYDVNLGLDVRGGVRGRDLVSVGGAPAVVASFWQRQQMQDRGGGNPTGTGTIELKTGLAVFLWDTDEGHFVLDESRSSWTRDELDDLGWEWLEVTDD